MLADRLGSDPGPELRALHGELLNPEGPEPIGDVDGSGPGPATRATDTRAPVDRTPATPSPATSAPA